MATLFAALAGCGPQPTVIRRPPATDARSTAQVQHPLAPQGTAAQANAARLAVLLPMSGALAAAAAPVRDGILAGYYGHAQNPPELRFYDSKGTAEGARQALAQALADGAVQVLGPLAREEVAAVFSATPPVPMLALNRSGHALPHNAASYSLAPEDEGRAAAHYLIAHNARRVLALSNGEDAAVRSIAALRSALQSGGGEVAQTIAISATPNSADTVRLRAALSGENAVDAIFIALRGNQARLLAAQWDRTRFGNRLRVATSQLLQGTGNAVDDRVLDGIVFPGEPWPAGRPQPHLEAASTLSERLPTARGASARLFAFGFDAWHLSVTLAHLFANPDTRLHGATGELRLDGAGMVERTPAWLTFRLGEVTVLGGE